MSRKQAERGPVRSRQAGRNPWLQEWVAANVAHEPLLNVARNFVILPVRASIEGSWCADPASSKRIGRSPAK
jgi:hypothetical protein